MDFRNSSNQPAQPGRTVNPGQPTSAMPPQNDHKDHKEKKGSFFSHIPMWLKVANVVLLFGITILIVAVISLLQSNNPNQSKYVMEDDYQAVFLDNGQVYFGKIAALTTQYIDLQKVFYLNSQSQTEQATNNNKDSNFTLVKLGCELHGPYDQMLINTDQVVFWENIRDDGQVVKTINEWIKQNPNGQKCSEASSGTQGTSSTNGSSTTNNTTTGTNTTNNSTTTNR